MSDSGAKACLPPGKGLFVIRERASQLKVGSLGMLPDIPFNVKVLVEAGIVRPTRPDKAIRVARELARWGASPAAGAAAAAIRYPNETMIIDELGSLTFAEVQSRSNRLARALAEAGRAGGRRRRADGAQPPRLRRCRAGDLEARRQRAVHEHDVRRAAAGRRGRARGAEGADLRRGVRASSCSGIDAELKRFVAWDQEGGTDDPSLEALIAAEPDDSDLKPTDTSSKFIVLTSGTTGHAEGGAARAAGHARARSRRLLSVIPLKARETTMIAAPLFHSWGFAHFSIGLSLSSTYVLRRKFDPEGTLEAVADQPGDGADRRAR